MSQNLLSAAVVIGPNTPLPLSCQSRVLSSALMSTYALWTKNKGVININLTLYTLSLAPILP